MAAEEAPDHLELLVERLGTQLAERVAEVQARFPAELAGADPSGQPIGRAQRLGAEQLCDLVAVHSLSAKVGAHAAVRVVEHAKMDVEQETADAVIQLAGDRVALVREQPAGLGGRRE